MNIDEALAAMDAYTFSAGGPTVTVYEYAKTCRGGERAYLDKVEAERRDMQRRYELVCHQLDEKIGELAEALAERNSAHRLVGLIKESLMRNAQTGQQSEVAHAQQIQGHKEVISALQADLSREKYDLSTARVSVENLGKELVTQKRLTELSAKRASEEANRRTLAERKADGSVSKWMLLGVGAWMLISGLGIGHSIGVDHGRERVRQEAIVSACHAKGGTMVDDRCVKVVE